MNYIGIIAIVSECIYPLVCILLCIEYMFRPRNEQNVSKEYSKTEVEHYEENEPIIVKEPRYKYGMGTKSHSEYKNGTHFLCTYYTDEVVASCDGYDKKIVGYQMVKKTRPKLLGFVPRPNHFIYETLVMIIVSIMILVIQFVIQQLDTPSSGNSNIVVCTFIACLIQLGLNIPLVGATVLQYKLIQRDIYV